MNYQELTHSLTPRYDLSEARAVVRLVLEQRFQMTFADVLCGKVNELSRDNRNALAKIMKRLETGEPVQYVLGECEFYGRMFCVRPGVLIPRPETEELVEWVISEQKQCRILDIGTGSGCISVSLAAELKADVTAWDISPDALSVASDNAKRHGVNLTLRQIDVLSDSPDGGVKPEDRSKTYDVIVSNPPYICDKERKDMEANVLDHEPHIALFVPDNDPLLFYRRIALLAKDMLLPGGALYFEGNREYAEDVAAMMRSMGYDDVEVRSDQYGNPRMIRGRIS